VLNYLCSRSQCEFSKSFLRDWQPSYSQPSEKMVWLYLVKYFVRLHNGHHRTQAECRHNDCFAALGDHTASAGASIGFPATW
jgi:hypothetical protein